MRYLLFLSFTAGACFGATIVVDSDGGGDYSNIQEAVNFSQNGDTIIVNPGYYAEDIHFNSRAVTLTGTAPADANAVEKTVINGTLNFDFLEGPDTVVTGFTIAGNFRITDDLSSISTSQKRPDISENTIVWENDKDIFGYNISTKTAFTVCKNTKTQQAPAISGDYVVWHDSRSGIFDIYGYNIAEQEEFSICLNDKIQLYPTIDGKIVAWLDTRNGNNDIYGYDLATNLEFEICTAGGNQEHQAISGNIIVWQDNRNSNYDIYGYDLAAADAELREFEICVETGEQTEAAIYGDIVVWVDTRNGNADIYGYRISTGQEFIVCDDAAIQEKPDVYNNVVVWQDYRNGNWDVWAYDIEAGVEFPILKESSPQSRPVIYGSTVLWEDYRDGKSIVYYSLLPSSYNGALKDVSNAIVCYSSSPTISYNYIYGCSENGIFCNETAAPVINNNIIAFNNIAIKGGSGIIKDNLITSNSGGGIADCNSVITFNSVNDNYGTGLVRCDGDIDNNKIENNNGDGLSDCDGYISNNRITANTSDGISGCNGEVVSNTVSSNYANGVFKCSGKVQANTISDNGGGVYSCDGQVLFNTIAANAGDGINSGSGKAYGNCITVNKGWGIRSFKGLASNNTVAANFKDGIFDCNDVINNTIVENLGSGIKNCSGNVVNNIIACNTGNGIYGPCDNRYNCLWDNKAGSFYDNHGGQGDFYENPRFVREGIWNNNQTPDDNSDDEWFAGDYHILSEYGRWDDDSSSWVIDNATSPCVDSGDPAEGIVYEENPNGGIINIGAFGGTEFASKGSIEGPEPQDPPVKPAKCVNPPSMDINDDCKIDIADFTEFARQWLTCGLDDPAACW